MTLDHLIRHKKILLFFPLLAFLLMYFFMSIPVEIDWKLGGFLCFVAIIERLYMQIYNKIWLPYFIITLGLIIFGQYSEFYSLFYLLPDFIYIWIKRNQRFLMDILPSFSISMITVVLGDQFYNLTNQGYKDRFLTLFLLFCSNWLLAYLFSFLESGKLTTTPLLNHFVPTSIEIFFIFPLLSSYSYFNYPIVLTTFFVYLLIIKMSDWFRLRIQERHVLAMINKFKRKDNLTIHLMDLGEIKGVFYPNKRLIVIDNKIDFPEQLQTLIHEWIHFKIRGKWQLSNLIEEILVTLLEAIFSWYIIFTINKKVQEANS